MGEGGGVPFEEKLPEDFGLVHPRANLGCNTQYVFREVFSSLKLSFILEEFFGLARQSP